MSEYNKTYRLEGEHVYRGAHMPGFSSASLLAEIEEYEFDDEDLLIATYSKCGTSLIQAIAYLVATEDFDHEETMQQLVPFLEMYVDGMGSGLDIVRARKEPGVIKTHLTPESFEKTLKKKKTKFIVCIRNIKDVLVSYYHMYRLCQPGYQNYKGRWDDFFEMFKEDRLAYGNYFILNKLWWEWRDDPRVLFVRYEDILKNKADMIRKVATFLGKTLSDESVDKIVQLTSFEVKLDSERSFKSMKKDPRYNRLDETFLDQSISPFLRKGKVGEWRNYFTKEQNEYVEKLVEEHFKPIGLDVEFD